MSAKLQLACDRIFYLDTATEVADIMITDIQNPLAETRFTAGRELSKVLSVRFEELMVLAQEQHGTELKDITGVCVFVGPGSFTGLRIGLSFANGLAFALGVPMYETKETRLIKLTNPKKKALPFYGSEPKITEPKKK